MADTRERHRYEQVYAQTYADLVRFVIRRGTPSDQAEDVVAEAFTVAWQRLCDLPGELGEARAWLFGITRHLLLAKRREAQCLRSTAPSPDFVDGENDSMSGPLPQTWPQREPDNLWGVVMDETGYNGSTNPEVTITLRDGSTITRRIQAYDVNY